MFVEKLQITTMGSVGTEEYPRSPLNLQHPVTTFIRFRS